ncbi:hypothetical protein Hanom_Chr03g00179941 [Helianthus anomalus]
MVVKALWEGTGVSNYNLCVQYAHACIYSFNFFRYDLITDLLKSMGFHSKTNW